jgi:hypothetical protein
MVESVRCPFEYRLEAFDTDAFDVATEETWLPDPELGALAEITMARRRREALVASREARAELAHRAAHEGWAQSGGFQVACERIRFAEARRCVEVTITDLRVMLERTYTPVPAGGWNWLVETLTTVIDRAIADAHPEQIAHGTELAARLRLDLTNDVRQQVIPLKIVATRQAGVLAAPPACPPAQVETPKQERAMASDEMAPEIEALAARIEAKAKEEAVLEGEAQKQVLLNDLGSRGLLQGGANYTGHVRIESEGVKKFRRQLWGELIELLRDAGLMTQPESPRWLRARMTDAVEGFIAGTTASLLEIQERQLGRISNPNPLDTELREFQRDLEIELGKLELRARVRAVAATGEARPDDQSKRYDVFIAHASEDKKEAAVPLASALRDRGCTVWIDEDEVLLGDNVVCGINVGIARAKFGVVILSPAFFAKAWPQHELTTFIALG